MPPSRKQVEIARHANFLGKLNLQTEIFTTDDITNSDIALTAGNFRLHSKVAGRGFEPLSGKVYDFKFLSHLRRH